MKVLDTDFARDFIRMCNDGWSFGWHEANGGNASYRMRQAEVNEVKSGFRIRSWERIDTEVPTLAGECFLITASGSHFRNIAHDPKRTLGIIEVDRTGTAWRPCWGFKDGGRPTSELVAHLINHEVRKAATKGASRVIYHAHPANIAAMTCVMPADPAVFTRTLWAQLAECAMVIPHGVELIPWEVPGSLGLAIESAKAMEHTNAVIWPHHGLFVSGDTLDEAFGIMQTVDKAAEIYLKARACGTANTSSISNDDLSAFSREYDLGLSRRNLHAEPLLDLPVRVIERVERVQETAPAETSKPQAGAPSSEVLASMPWTFSFPAASAQPVELAEAMPASAQSADTVVAQPVQPMEAAPMQPVQSARPAVQPATQPTAQSAEPVYRFGMRLR